MIQSIKSCSFTGHRPKAFSFGYREDCEAFFELRNRMKNTIVQACNAGCRVFYCGMAEGADLWCGEIVLELQHSYDPPLQIVPVVPFLAQPVAMTEQNKIRYRNIMENASQRFLVSKQFTKACYQKRNRFLVDASDALIAVFKDTEIRSGTAQTIRYAKKKNKKIFLISI